MAVSVFIVALNSDGIHVAMILVFHQKSGLPLITAPLLLEGMLRNGVLSVFTLRCCAAQGVEHVLG